MHTLIVTPYNHQGLQLSKALKRKNIKSILCSPNNLCHEWSPDTDGIIFPHPLDAKSWETLEPLLTNLKRHIPVILIGELHYTFLKNKIARKTLKQVIFLEDGLALNQIPILIKDIIGNNEELKEKRRQLRIGDLILDRSNRTLKKNGRIILLTGKEFFLLELLMLNAGNVTTRDTIIDYVWDKRSYIAQNTIDVYIHRLRQKLKDKSDKPLIRTLPCLGYEFQI